jgi:hypothetical protein
MTEIVNGLVFYVVFLHSTTLHEAAHAWAALKGGDPTAYHGGQVTLDPRPHIRREPIGIFVAWQVFSFFFDPAFTFALNVLYFPFGVSYS